MPPSVPPSPTSSGGGSVLLCIIGVVVAAATLFGFYVLTRRSRERPLEHSSPDPTDPYGTISTEQLAAEGNSALVAADDALKTSEQELNFATAQYGAAATTDFAAALKASQTDVTAAFHLRQQLDDEIPDTEAQQRKWYAEIIERCQVANGRMDAQVESFDRLRNMEANLETLMPNLRTKRAGAQEKLPATTAAYEALQQRYAPSAVRVVADSRRQIQDRLDFADRTIEQANSAIEAGNRPLAALAVRAAEEGLAQIDLIHDGVTRLATDLEKATASVNAMLADLDTDVASGQAALSASGGSPASADLAAAIAGTQQVVATVRTETATGPDPFDQLRRLQAINVRIDTALASVREAASRAQRARDRLDQAIAAAQAQIEGVRNFITTRRGAVGSDARTRLAGAERKLAEAMALADRDPAAALSAAQQADSLAAQAGMYAQDDVSDWDQPAIGGGGAAVLGGIGGAILGGILLGGHGGFGGGMGGMGGTTFGWGGRMPGSFGGPGTRVRFRL